FPLLYPVICSIAKKHCPCSAVVAGEFNTNVPLDTRGLPFNPTQSANGPDLTSIGCQNSKRKRSRTADSNVESSRGCGVHGYCDAFGNIKKSFSRKPLSAGVVRFPILACIHDLCLPVISGRSHFVNHHRLTRDLYVIAESASDLDGVELHTTDGN